MADTSDAFRGQLSPELLTLLQGIMDAGSVDQSFEVLSADAALSVEARYTELQVTGTDAYTLADGTYIGQIKEIWCSVAATTPVGVVTPASFGGGLTDITFDAVDEYVKLLWDGSNWIVVQNIGATLA